MAAMDLGELARAVEAEIVGGALPMSVEAVGTDSRSLPSAALFVALRGERFDGHDFVRQALAGGARAVLVDREGSSKLGDLSIPRLVVKDTLRALGELARRVRRRRAAPVVAVTGSNGKTTTKELIYAVLSSRGAVHKTSGNLNNLIGMPLTILAWPDSAWAAILEMGMNASGEIARLTEIAAPDVGLITNVGPAHLEGLKTLDGVARAKGELYSGLPTSAVAIVNSDDRVIRKAAWSSIGSRQRLTFGTEKGADVRVLAQALIDGGSRVRYEILGRPCDAELPLVGPHNAINGAAAIAVALAMGIDAEVAARSIKNVAVPGGRFRAVELADRGVHLIDDTYNANPASMRAAFATMAQLVTKGRIVAVLGDMLELGATSFALHREVGEAAVAAGVGWILTFGENAAQISRAAQAAGATASHFESLESLCAALDQGLTRGDWLLVKGSRGMRMERVVLHLIGGRS